MLENTRQLAESMLIQWGLFCTTQDQINLKELRTAFHQDEHRRSDFKCYEPKKWSKKILPIKFFFSVLAKRHSNFNRIFSQSHMNTSAISGSIFRAFLHWPRWGALFQRHKQMKRIPQEIMQQREVQTIPHMWIAIGLDCVLEWSDYNLARPLSTTLKAGVRCWHDSWRDWTDYMGFYLRDIKSRELPRACWKPSTEPGYTEWHQQMRSVSRSSKGTLESLWFFG
jgi:hypothetical protein